MTSEINAMIRDIEGGVIIDILVVPRASRSRLGPVHGDRIKVSVTAPPVDGKANQAVIEILAKTLGVRRSHIEIISGHTSRRKTIKVSGIDSAALRAFSSPP